MKFPLRSSIAAALVLTVMPAIFGAEKKKPTKPIKAEATTAAEGVAGWISWRGPAQNGTSPETGLPEKIDAKNALWTADFPGQGSPVVFKGKLYINGYFGEGADLQEGISCFDAETGKLLWRQMANDFLSDT